MASKPAYQELELQIQDLETRIAESDAVEEKLKTSRELYRKMFDHAGLAIVVTDARTGKVVACNRKAHEELGYSRKEYLSLSHTDYQDNGQGMDKKTQEHIFEPFYTTKTVGEGTGLGLSMAYGIVKNHQGAILCESRKGSGTVFNIYLPAIHVNAKKLEKKTKTEAPKGKGETILVIDDEEVLRRLLSQVLTLHEYRVLTAASGEEALTLYDGHQEEIALVVLDMIMPGMGGKNCMKRILSKNPGAKILLTTGFPSKDKRNEAEKEGALGFIEKPFDFGDILRVIRKVIAPFESNGVP